MSSARTSRLPSLPLRPHDAHKGSFGHVFIIAGSEGMSGAACLCGYGALRGGAGLVTIAAPRCVTPIIAATHPAWMTCPLDDEQGVLSASCIPQIDAILASATSIAVGPGLRSDSEVVAIVRHVYETSALPMVVDADGLNGLASAGFDWQSRPAQAPRVLTPHPGEFSRMTGRSVADIQSQREAVAMQFASQQGLTLLLKGAGTVITDGNRLAINPTGNPGMAKGGSGDVLTGIVASLLAQGLEAFEAAQLAAYVHGAAGDLAAERFSQRSMTADELQREIGSAWKMLESK